MSQTPVDIGQYRFFQPQPSLPQVGGGGAPIPRPADKMQNQDLFNTLAQQNYWSRMANANAYSDAMRQSALSNMYKANMDYLGQLAQTGASRYQTEGQLQGILNMLPYQLAGQVIPAQMGANASMYGANRAGQAQEQAAYYPAAAHVQTAAYEPSAAMNAARMQALSNMNVAQIDAQRKLTGLQQILSLLRPEMAGGAGALGQGAMPMGVSTNYGAGVSYSR